MAVVCLKKAIFASTMVMFAFVEKPIALCVLLLFLGKNTEKKR